MFFQVLKNLVVRGRVSSTDGKVFRWIHTAILVTAVGSKSVYSWFDPVKMARTLTCLYGKTVFSGVEEPCCPWKNMFHGSKGVQMESISTMYHCTWLRKCVFMVWSSKTASILTGIHWRTVFPGIEEPCGTW